jgi:hypothetical protein
MPMDRYRIGCPTTGLILEGDRHVSVTIPEGATIAIEGETFNGEWLVDVTWDDKAVMMFTQDLRSRGKKID